MDLNHTSAFIRVVEEESFTAAAKALGLTTSRVSRSVAMLEEQLGVRLLQRTTRRVSLTDAGRAYFDRTRTPMAALRSASEDISQAGKEPRGVVRLTATLGFSVSFLPHVVADFIDRYPMVQFDLLFTSQPLDLVKENIDIAIRAGHLKESSLIARRVGKMVFGLFASPKYLRRRGTPKTIAELLQHDCLRYRPPGRYDWKLTDGKKEETVAATGPLLVDDTVFMHQAILCGVGIGLLPLHFMASPRGGLRRLMDGYTWRELPLSVVWASRQHEPARVTLFRDFLIGRLASVPWLN
jgi:DNA-binding transcriptional LysR family regulator